MCFRPAEVSLDQTCPKCGEVNDMFATECASCGEPLAGIAGGGVPGSPSMPGAPGVPSMPSAPGIPGAPGVPGAPTAPGVPSAPGIPAAPGSAQ